MINREAYIKGWNRIFRNKSLGALLPIPAEASGIIINYTAEFTLYCILPPKKRSLKCYLKNKPIVDFELTTPLLLLEILYLPLYSRTAHVPPCMCDICDQYKLQGTAKVFYELDNNFYPYLLPNIWATGRLCFGNAKKSLNPRLVNSYLWSNFNDDFSSFYAETSKEFSEKIIKRNNSFLSSPTQIYDDIDPPRPLHGNFVTTKNLKPGISYAVFVSQHPKILKNLPEDLYRYSYSFGSNLGPYVFGLAHKNNDHWIVDFTRGHKRELISTEFRIPK